jgi:group I intron endonuclease
MLRNPNFFGEVYVHTCLPNGKSYVGQTTAGVPSRWRDQVKITRWTRNAGYEYPLSHAIRKYGKDAFEHQVLATASSKEELDNLERLWIWALRTCEDGYNLARGGEGNPGLAHTPESKKKISQNRKGKGIGNRNAAGTVRSEENRRKDSLRLQGKTYSVTHRENIRRARAGIKRPDVTAANLRRWAAIRAKAVN